VRARFPDSGSSSQFWDNLRDGRDMVTLDGRRWPAGLHNTPGRFGKLLEFDRFDASFFSVHGKQAQVRASGRAPPPGCCVGCPVPARLQRAAGRVSARVPTQLPWACGSGMQLWHARAGKLPVRAMLLVTMAV